MLLINTGRIDVSFGSSLPLVSVAQGTGQTPPGQSLISVNSFVSIGSNKSFNDSRLALVSFASPLTLPVPPATVAPYPPVVALVEAVPRA